MPDTGRYGIVTSSPAAIGTRAMIVLNPSFPATRAAFGQQEWLNPDAAAYTRITNYRLRQKRVTTAT